MTRSTPIVLGLLLLGPAAAPLKASEAPQDDTRIVIRDGEVIRLDDDDRGPRVIHVDGLPRRVYIGIRPIELTPELRVHYGAPREAGVLVGEVEADSPAAKGGLQVGDIITSVEGEKIDAPLEISRAIRRKKDGETVKIDVVRDKAVKHLSVAVAERKATEMAWSERRPRAYGRSIHIPDFEFHWPDRGDLNRLNDRLEELEKKLKELEKKLAR
ncbi:MAG: S1C family serine protease [Thermoanaerobaculia bacterium]